MDALVIPIPIPSLPLVLVITGIASIAYFTQNRTTVISSGPSVYHSLAGAFSLRSNWLTFAVFLTLAIVYISEAASLAKVPSSSLPNLAGLGAISRTTLLQGEWYRLFTAPFLHGGLLHLFFNSIALFFASRILEYRVGRLWLLAIYFISAWCGSIFSVILNKSDTLSVGASGAIMGLFAAIMLISFHSNSSVHRFNLFYVSLRVLVPSLLPFFFHSDGSHVDYAAHLGGFIGGGLCALIMLISWPEDSFPQFRQFTMAVIAFGILITGVSFLKLAYRPEFKDLNNCLGTMKEVAQQAGTDPAKYIKDNSAYLQNCVKYYLDNNH